MKLFYFYLIIIFLSSCSFDNKSGIWSNESFSISKKDDQFKDFKKFSSSEKLFNEIIEFDDNYKFKISTPKKNIEWKDIFYKNNNNLDNFKYKDLNELSFKSKKISRNKINNLLLFKSKNLVANDENGDLIIFSTGKDNFSHKFNFYKKKYKKIKKKLNLILENNIIFVSDNLGYLYAYNYSEKKILWAKKYKIPFRSNLKITEKMLIASNQNNELIFFDKNNGNIIKAIPTEEDIIKNQFINSLSLDKNSLYFLNSFGSLYSVSLKNIDINWFINLNQSTDLNPSNLFLGNEIINENNKIVISANQSTYIINSENGSILSKFDFSTNLKPLIYENYIFFITKNNLIICMNINTSEIIYSYDINQLIADFLKIDKKDAIFKSYMILNSQIFIFLENSYVLKFKMNGSIDNIYKLPSKIKSQPIIIDESILFLNKKNNLVIIN
ncbi:MAG: PQQ-binding-like beta-propeller repeat protein [Candidatus Pelagibacter bacterium]|nr:PQQ-binding-like beta-propeller repeat protein [Candidatus Pelagibacter bacterium]